MKPLAVAGSGDQACVVPPDTQSLYLVRHAQPLIAPGVCYGALDVPADAQASRQAAQMLAQQLPKQAFMHVSLLQRCELLRQHLCALRPDLSYKSDARLMEMDFGRWEGRRWDSIPQAAYDAWTADFWQHRFGDAESVAEFMARVEQVWCEVRVHRARGVAQVWLTHAGVIRAVHLLSQGVREVHEAALWPAAAPAFGQCVVIGGP